jgi:leucyl aminopeptidase (aminopeptidase T)
LPDYSTSFIKNKSIIVDYKRISKRMRKYHNILTRGNKIKILSKFGTNIDILIKGRKANFCPGFVKKRGDLGSPPDIETNISPVEFCSNGEVIVNGSITHPKIKLLKNPVNLKIEKGRILKIKTKNVKVKKILYRLFGKKNSKKRILAECGIGFNPKAKLSGHMLTDEGSQGCIHLGFGSNYTVGGNNKVDFHIDLILKNTTLLVDREHVIREGKLFL